MAIWTSDISKNTKLATLNINGCGIWNDPDTVHLSLKTLNAQWNSLEKSRPFRHDGKRGIPSNGARLPPRIGQVGTAPRYGFNSIHRCP